jgi:hypothetical protein
MSSFAQHPYSGLRAGLASMHRKERAIAPPCWRHLRLTVEPVLGLDTDAFGTFTGEIARPGTARETALAKALLAAEASGHRLGLGSEGSFGPHHALPFLAQDVELIALHDRETGITISEGLGSLRTNYGQIEWSCDADLSAFLTRSLFPSHGLVVSPAAEAEAMPIIKGIRDPAALARAIDAVRSKSGDVGVRLATDMRAHMNPTRMAVIRAAATRLARRAATLCPSCGCPGYGETRHEPGILCEGCEQPTPLIKWRVTGCLTCQREERRPNPKAPLRADPRYCARCNP